MDYLTNSQATAQPNDPGEPNIDRLLQLIRERICTGAQGSAALGGDQFPQEIILDIWINRARYILTRQIQMPAAYANLSPREKEIVCLVMKGYSNKVIAAKLRISSWTVATHLRRIFAKVGSSSRAEMVARVIQDNLLAMPEAGTK
jgi:DNA-binding CsgD family transcriptional regulator